MRTSYNEIAGQNVERLAALSDGIFAVAITLLVLDLRYPLPRSFTVSTTCGMPSLPLLRKSSCIW
jgi:uncharacterized membrane protein